MRFAFVCAPAPGRAPVPAASPPAIPSTSGEICHRERRQLGARIRVCARVRRRCVRGCLRCDCRLTDRPPCAAPVPPAGAGVAVESSCRRGIACRHTRSLLVRWSGRGGGGGARVMCRVVRLCVFTSDCAVLDNTSCAVRACCEHVASMLVYVCLCACVWMGLGRTRVCASSCLCAFAWFVCEVDLVRVRALVQRGVE